MKKIINWISSFAYRDRGHKVKQMKNKFICIIAVLGVCFCSSLIFAVTTAGELQTIVTGNSKFGLELYQQLKADPGNLFFSPYSISTALAMTYAGARGETEKEMAKVLNFTIAQEFLHPAYSKLQKYIHGYNVPSRSQSEVQHHW